MSLLRALRPWRFFGFAIAKQALQKARAFWRGWGFQLAQRFALQTAEFTQQQRHFPRLADPTVQLLGEFLQRLGDFPRQRQRLQLGNQRGQRGADLINAGLAALLWVTRRRR